MAENDGEHAKLDPASIEIASYRAGPEADEPCVQMVIPGSDRLNMHAVHALQLSARLACAAIGARIGIEAEVYVGPDDDRVIVGMFAQVVQDFLMLRLRAARDPDAPKDPEKGP